MTRPIKKKLIFMFHVNSENFSYKLGQGITTFVLIDFAWIFFRASSLADAMAIIKRMFSFNIWVLFDGSLYQLGLDNKDFNVAIMSIGLLAVVDMRRGNRKIRDWFEQQNLLFKAVTFYGAIFIILVLGIYGYGYNASDFIYFQF